MRDTVEKMAVASALNFVRAIFVAAGRAHVESRCRSCGFRIACDSSVGFAQLEQRHADTCRGAVAD